MKKNKFYKIILSILMIFILTGCETSFTEGWNVLSTERKMGANVDFINNAETSVNTHSQSILDIVGDIWVVVIFIGAMAFIISVGRFAHSANNPRERESAVKGMKTSLITVAISGGINLIMNFIIALLHAMGLI